ncbi:putative lysine--tRNA ligase, cytoplasmic [Cucumispora dikerogammari]|nr:putative lysine--tRNA ligase, cytoplasmic [Cucumispora dikerogammari]
MNVTNNAKETVETSTTRKQNIQTRLDNGEKLYIHKWDSKNRIEDIVNKYKTVTEFNETDFVQSAGRVMSIRELGKLTFIVIMEGGCSIQLIAFKSDTLLPAVENITNKTDLPKTGILGDVLTDLYRGDIIGFNGQVMRSKTNELSIKVAEIKILAPCVKTLPTTYYGVKDPDLVYRRRYLDLIMNNQSRNRFVTRAKIISFLRNYLDSRNFIEVETPILDTSVGGANAKPFTTYQNDLKIDMFMRISPELYHKKLIVGGLERVYEIGKVFRNEGVDLTHNPEFTSCEFYMAYADYFDLIKITEEFLSECVQHICGTKKITYAPEKRSSNEDIKVEIDFSTPFKQLDLLEELCKHTGLDLTGENLEEKTPEMIAYCEKLNLYIEEPQTTARVIDKLVGHFIEPQCVNPTFIINHPLVMSPLAKSHRTRKGITERFELFVNSKEICNAYTELNDPFDQKRRFLEQVKDKDLGDEEAMMLDETFVEALEYGLCPTGGWGIGIDRLTMYLTSASNIRDVILFPTMKPENK